MSFRLKLILSYAAVIFLTLLLSTLLFSLIAQQIQQNQRQEADQRLARQTRTVQDSINSLCPPRLRCTATLTQYRQILVQYSGLSDVRILMVDELGIVRADTNTKEQGNLQDRNLAYKLVPRDDKTHSGLITLGDTDYIYYALPGPKLDLSDAEKAQISSSVNSDLLLSVPQATLERSWTDFVKGTVFAGLLSLGLAIMAAIFIARSVAKPLIRMTRASEAIALGDYSQQLPEPKESNGRDEVGRLAISFNRMAREVARSQQTMRDFVANVSHELKTPLTSIQGFSQAILDGTADDRVSLEHSAAVINHEAARMRRLVDELLDLSRIESGQVELVKREIDLEKLLERVVGKLEPLAAAKRITLHPFLTAYRYQPEVQSVLNGALSPSTGPLIMGDSDRLEQIFTNILDNAIKYSPEGGEVGLKLRLSGAEGGKPNGATPAGRFYWAVVEISNRGPLIPPDLLQRIFERFYKLDKSRAKRRGESTGLGLAIAKELVEAHKGMISVTSQPLDLPVLYPVSLPPSTSQEGLTTFTVSLPLLALPVMNPQQLVGLSADTRN